MSDKDQNKPKKSIDDFLQDAQNEAQNKLQKAAQHELDRQKFLRENEDMMEKLDDAIDNLYGPTQNPDDMSEEELEEAKRQAEWAMALEGTKNELLERLGQSTKGIESLTGVESTIHDKSCMGVAIGKGDITEDVLKSDIKDYHVHSGDYECDIPFENMHLEQKRVHEWYKKIHLIGDEFKSKFENLINGEEAVNNAIAEKFLKFFHLKANEEYMIAMEAYKACKKCEKVLHSRELNYGGECKDCSSIGLFSGFSAFKS